MSKYNNELHKHKAADTIKWIVAFVLIIAIMGAVVCLALQVSGVFDFFKKDDVPVEEIEPSQDESDVQDIVVSDTFFEHGIALTSAAFTAASGDNVQTLTASVTNASGVSDGLDTTVEWSVAWKNPASTWATGKTVTEYLTCVPTSDGGLVATVTALQPFGEQITIKCTSVVDSEKFATATVDYAKRVQAVRVLMDDKEDLNLNLSDSLNSHTFKISGVTYGIGTIEPTSVGYTLYLTASSEFKSLVSGLTENVGGQDVYKFSVSSNAQTFSNTGSFDLKLNHGSPTGSGDQGKFHDYTMGFVTMKVWNNSYVNLMKALASLKKALNGQAPTMKVFDLRVSCSLNYNNLLRRSDEITQSFLLGTCSFNSLKVSSVTLDENSLVL